MFETVSLEFGTTPTAFAPQIEVPTNRVSQSI